MTASIVAIRLRAESTLGMTGAFVRFTPGLNVIRGANSRGKSQLLNSIIYTLGVEALFGPNAGTGLGSVLTRRLLYGSSSKGYREAEVRRSWCAIELRNSAGQVITVQRPVVGSSLGANLVRLWRGPMLSMGEAPFDGDYFVRERGVASGRHGFHRVLAEFLGWDLPQVPRYSADPIVLYPEIIFPFLFVDQRSWGTATPRRVSHYQIKDPLRRSVEFLLDLEGPAAEAARQQLENRLVDLRARWKSNVENLSAAASLAGIRVFGLPENVAGARGVNRAPVAPTDVLHLATVQVAHDQEWRPVTEAIQRLGDVISKSRLEELPTSPPPDTAQLQAELLEAQNELEDLIATAAAVESNLTLAEAQTAALDRRLASLEEEQVRNNDVKTLIRLGSSHAASHLADSDCPTCHQSLIGVEAESLGPVLSIDDTIALLSSQIATARAMREQAVSSASQPGSTAGMVGGRGS